MYLEQLLWKSSSHTALFCTESIYIVYIVQFQNISKEG